MIEQALYASAHTQTRDGYQVVAASSGACAEELRELPLWFPSHDGLSDKSGQSASLNSFPLPSGAHCVARSFAAEPEYSGRGGTHVVTHALLLPSDDFARFANNPFAVMQAAVAAGRSTAAVARERSLVAFNLAGRARGVDASVVRQAVARCSAASFARALEVCLTADTAVIAAPEDPGALIAGLLHCVPIGLRARLSLATGLVYSPSRPYQWIAHPGEPHALRHLERTYGVRVASIMPEGTWARGTNDVEIEHGWAEFVRDCLDAGRFADLERGMQQMARARNAAELDALAAQELSASAQTSDATPLAAPLSMYSSAPLETMR